MMINFHIRNYNVKDIVLMVAGGCKTIGGRAFIVGGWVRDKLRSEPTASPDVDIEVYGLSIQQVEDLLDNLDLAYDAVGRSFGILKLKDVDIDISVPRRENRIGVKHTDFSVELDPTMTPEEAALRRDFTMNSMYWDPISKRLYDPYGGQRDLTNGVLRMTNQDKFAEDPLRVLRAMQFISRFALTADPDLVWTAKQLQIQYVHIAKERVFEEFKKMLLKGKYISEGLQFLIDCDWIHNFPELEAMIGVEQEPDWHPEGDVFTHVSHCMDAFARLHIYGDDMDRLIVGFGTLCHDMGKPGTTLKDPETGRIQALKHHMTGVPIAEKFMRRLTDDHDLIEAVKSMVYDHMFTANFNKQSFTPRSIKRLARRCPSIDLLCYVIQCDKEGRPPLVADLKDVVNLRAMAQEMDVYNQPPPPIMMGRHLIEHLGMAPGLRFGEILRACQEAEDDGVITDVESGLAYIKAHILDEGNDT